ncbi:MAG: hypothetical protein QNJ73_06085 [Gammaproteobacteria bacterium]|nr:hypothetical protein [Gammaproteobacteria bacterium]
MADFRLTSAVVEHLPALGVIAWILLLGSGDSHAQVNNPDYADYLLVGRFGEMCTMCEAVVLCEPGMEQRSRDGVPDNGSFDLYHLQTRTFWSQVGTIWEWFLSNFNEAAVDGHTRPVQIYRIDDGNWSDPTEQEARLTLDPPLLAIDGLAVDRASYQWRRTEDAAPVGYCQVLPLWDSLDVIAARRPGVDP